VHHRLHRAHAVGATRAATTDLVTKFGTMARQPYVRAF
jgi:hypothetical protein